MSPHAENMTMHLSRPVQTEVDIFDLNPKWSLEVLNQSLYIRRIYSSTLVLMGDGVFEAAQVVLVGDSWLKKYLYVIWLQNPSNLLRVSMLIWYDNSGFSLA